MPATSARKASAPRSRRPARPGPGTSCLGVRRGSALHPGTAEDIRTVASSPARVSKPTRTRAPEPDARSAPLRAASDTAPAPALRLTAGKRRSGSEAASSATGPGNSAAQTSWLVSTEPPPIASATQTARDAVRARTAAAARSIAATATAADRRTRAAADRRPSSELCAGSASLPRARAASALGRTMPPGTLPNGAARPAGRAASLGRADATAQVPPIRPAGGLRVPRVEGEGSVGPGTVGGA